MSSDQASETSRHEHKPRQPAWIAGGVLILIGVIFLVRSAFGFELNNWWALFILIPALGSLGTAWQMFERNGRRFTAASQGPLIGGLILLAVTAVFLFSLDWGRIWPVFLILAGLAAVLTSIRRKD
jgi:hypothetical protein